MTFRLWRCFFFALSPKSYHVPWAVSFDWLSFQWNKNMYNAESSGEWSEFTHFTLKSDWYWIEPRLILHWYWIKPQLKSNRNPIESHLKSDWNPIEIQLKSGCYPIEIRLRFRFNTHPTDPLPHLFLVRGEQQLAVGSPELLYCKQHVLLVSAHKPSFTVSNIFVCDFADMSAFI